MSRERIPQTAVLAWLSTNHPDLFQSVELDREWVWITASLKPPHKDCDCAESAKLAGGRRAFASDCVVVAERHPHLGPSGKVGSCGHSCLRPIPCKRKRSDGGTARDNQPAEPTRDDSDAVRREALAFLNPLS